MAADLFRTIAKSKALLHDKQNNTADIRFLHILGTPNVTIPGFPSALIVLMRLESGFMAWTLQRINIQGYIFEGVFMQAVPFTLENILKELSLSELEYIVFKGNECFDSFITLPDAESRDFNIQEHSLDRPFLRFRNR